MPYKIRGKIAGLPEVMKSLERVKEGVRARILRRPMGKVARLIAKKAKALAPRRFGLLRKSMGSKVKTYKGGAVVAVVGPRTGFRTQVGSKRDGTPVYADPVKYAHLVELGTATTAARPFLRPALRGSRKEAAEIIRRGVAEGLAAEANKAAARGRSIYGA